MGAFPTKTTERTRFAFWTKEELRSAKSWLTFGLRLSLGWIFLFAGIDKLLSELATGKSATSGYLQFATAGPLAGFFQALAGNPVVDALVVWGMVLVGAALVLGAFTRVAAVSGVVMMLLIYASVWPPAHNPFMDEHVIYALALGLLAFVGAGRFLGVDRFLEKLRIVQRFPRLKALLG